MCSSDLAAEGHRIIDAKVHAAADDLRGKMLEKKAKMKVIKKTLFNIAAKEAGYPEVPAEALGDQPIAFIFSFEDMVSGAKVAFEFSKTSDAVELVGGVLDGKVLSKEEAVDLAKMLSREEMLAKFAAMLRAPLQNFASMSASPLSSLARAMKEMANKGGATPEVAPEAPEAEPSPADAEPATEETPASEQEKKEEGEEEAAPDTPESTDS